MARVADDAHGEPLTVLQVHDLRRLGALWLYTNEMIGRQSVTYWKRCVKLTERCQVLYALFTDRGHEYDRAWYDG